MSREGTCFLVLLTWPLVKFLKSVTYPGILLKIRERFALSVDRSYTLLSDVLRPDSRVLVTGGTGFVGSHLVDALCQQNVQVRVLARKTSDRTRLQQGVEVIEGDLQDEAALQRAVHSVELIFHLAAATRARSERGYVEANAEGTRRLINAIQTVQPKVRRLVYLSSLAAVGPAHDGKPVQREDLPHPITAYGRSKLAGEQFCLHAVQDLEVLMLRA